ncbi:glyoxalase [Mesorhizobium sp. L-8-10]|uniref:VOC family protein n=1 Tax=Mesorhizobium sp. L-8-10 TaxID=2744523 RepID=UPI0019263381|nr:VOC family protein [Mesorhizobium sp. L-8-10]BCH30746.1 glyoxalase [Mesorhizobium sp. L-8-10]
MKLNHANLCTTDVAGLADFFTRHFGFELVAMRGNDAFAILRGTDGFALNLMRPGKGGGADYPEGFHIGFLIDDGDEVRAKHAEMTEAGLRPDEIQNLMRGGAATTVFYCLAPGGLLVEVSADVS